MNRKPTYTALEQRVRELERILNKHNKSKDDLQIRDKMFQTILDTALDSIFCKGLDRKYTFVNPSMSKLLGYTKEDLIGKVPEEVYSKEDADIVNEVDARTFKGENVSEVRSLTISGRPYTFHTIQIPMRDSAGNVIGISGIVRDITELTQTKEKVIQSEALLAKAQQMSHIGNWNWDIISDRVSFSDEMYRIVGLSPKEFTADYESYAKCIHPDDLEMFNKLSEKVIKEKKHYNAEYRILRPDKETRYVYEQGDVTLDSNGNVISLFGIIQDITERKLSEIQYQNIIESAIDGFVVFDRQGYLLDVNNAVCAMHGYRREELLQMNISELNAIDTPDELAGRIKKITNQGYDSFETRHRCKNGTIIDLEINVRHLDIRKGLFVAFSRDVTQKEKDRKALQENERRFRIVADFAYNWESWLDTNGEYLYVSPSFERITGYAPDKLLDDHRFIETIVHPEDRKKISEHLFHHSDRDKVQSVDFRIIARNGDSRWISHICQPVKDDEGNLLGRRASNQDITEKKELEERYRHAQKMEAIGILAGGIAHDFNNILSAILGFGELAKMDVERGTNIDDRLTEILNAGNRAKDLVGQILAFSRQSEKKLAPVNVGLIVKEALKLVRASLPNTIDIREKIEPGLAPIMADPTLIHQIMMNLCTNAGHAMQENGGVLEVSLSTVAVEPDFIIQYPELSPGPHLKLTVSDTGCGISLETMKQIFLPFFTTKKKGIGTGMGLSMVEGTVKETGGEITVSSKIGKGTTFCIYLPQIKNKITTEKQFVKPMMAGDERLLFVDDEPSLLKLAEQMLGQLGYKVTVRNSSIEALELFRANPNQFDLVISDMTMPKMTGVQLAIELMKIRKNIPIILCTGLSDNMTEEKIKSMRIKALLMKPIVQKEMAVTIRRVLDNKSSNHDYLSQYLYPDEINSSIKRYIQINEKKNK